MNKANVSIKQFKYDKQTQRVEAQYSVEHNNGKTSVEHTLTISGDTNFLSENWSAEMVLTDFPKQSSAHDAAFKLADWLERMALAIRAGDYTMPSCNPEFKDLDQITAM